MAAGLAERWPAMNSRGPRNRPCSTAALMPQSAPPVSRSVVKPRISMARIEAEAFADISVSGWSDSRRMFTSVSTTWMWASISPGISVRPPRSMRCARGAGDRAVGDFADDAVLDEDLHAVEQFVAAGIEQSEVVEQEAGHGLGSLMRTGLHAA